ncbi:hypothetical protein RND81_04G001700 [Saponaria officinalis]|uniref:MULE transposase domain-containing protein n=1 Tax=Saponaria officinalis TaxID=3572 RepID=A0AAW1LG44_SAPOF
MVNMEFDLGEQFAAQCFMYAYKSGIQFNVRTSDILDVYKEKGIRRNGVGDSEAQFHMMKKISFICSNGRVSKTNPDHVPIPCKVFVDGRIKFGTDKHIGEYFKKRMMLNDRAGIPVTRSFNTLVMEGRGYKNLLFNYHDMRNAINKERRKGRFRGDAHELINYFDILRRENLDFFYAVQIDVNGALLNIFWADTRCRAMYKAFSDPLSYDTTFLSNRYRMPFSPFVGVNHYGSTVIFAAALMSYENTETFEWVFKKWIECMGRAPRVMITDQCKAMEGAVRKFFPDTKHRLCLWHILQNVDKNLRSHPKFTRIDRDMQTLVHKSTTEEEFLNIWAEMVEKYHLPQNTWVREALSIRRRWVLVHWMNTFCAGLSSTQRSNNRTSILRHSST